MAKRNFWDIAPSKDFGNLLSWLHLDKLRYSAARARILLIQSETDFDFHGPSLNKFTIGPAKMRILVKREHVSSATSQITEAIRTATSERLLNQISSKISSKLSATSPGNSVSLGSELLTKDEYELTTTTERTLSDMRSYTVTSTVGQEHEMTLENPDGERIAEERRRYKQVTWDFYLHSCEFLELEYDRKWFWPTIKRTFKAPVSTKMGWPLVRLVFYVPQPEMDIRWEGDVKKIIDFPDKIEAFPLKERMPNLPAPVIDSLEKLARLAFPATKEEKKASGEYRRTVKKAAKKAPAKKAAKKAPAKKAAAKKAPAKKAAAKKAPAKKAAKKRM